MSSRMVSTVADACSGHASDRPTGPVAAASPTDHDRPLGVSSSRHVDTERDPCLSLSVVVKMRYVVAKSSPKRNAAGWTRHHPCSSGWCQRLDAEAPGDVDARRTLREARRGSESQGPSVVPSEQAGH